MQSQPAAALIQLVSRCKVTGLCNSEQLVRHPYELRPTLAGLFKGRHAALNHSSNIAPR